MNLEIPPQPESAATVFYLVSIAVVMVSFGALYAAAAWIASRRAGTKWLPMVWVAGWLTLWAMVLGQLYANGAAAIPPRTGLDWLAVLGSCSIFFGATGLATLSVFRSARRIGNTAGSVRPIVRGTAAFLGGSLLGLVPIVAIDLWGLLVY